MRRTFLVDHGQQLVLDADQPPSGPACLGAARLASVQASANAFTVWLQLRGSAWVEAKEGRFALRRGQWLAFERDSRPLLQTDRDGLCIGLSLDGEALKALGRMADETLYAGRGELSSREMRTALRLWRQAAARPGDALAMRPVLLHLASMQGELSRRVQRCPGRSRVRKRQVFGRMQRARLYLDGHRDRVVRISELAELTNFSSWYLSKTFHSLYEESPQALSARLRLKRAADLLRDTTMMIGEVAAASGFDNCCSFARAFRARFGVSASQYRHRDPVPPESAKSAGDSGKATARTGT
ncbi:helix-turn-helix transcriptional regulator [Xanthomonas sacchari]|uniref:helix-turn-helix transcriptional regulator n=1 Tax=Xanthomonas sacchari TaxID=56458 RepID=UPI000581C27C|nr:helix-turn-helix transcriptional regulator [Xanthomonas sacchari]AJC47256.1 AraC family transcriptional regulator [Xanthomonas sacchari]